MASLSIMLLSKRMKRRMKRFYGEMKKRSEIHVNSEGEKRELGDYFPWVIFKCFIFPQNLSRQHELVLAYPRIL